MKKTALSNYEFTKWAELWYKDCSIKSRLLQKYRPFICPFKDLLELIPDDVDSMLDVGCGNGFFSLLALQYNKISNATGIDLNSNSISNAKKAFATQKMHISGTAKFISSEAELFTNSTKFDAIVMIDVLHHVPSIEVISFVERYVKLLADNGTLIIKDMGVNSWWRKAANQLHDLVIAREWIHHIPPTQLVEMLKKSELCLSKDKYFEWNTYWYEHYAFTYSKKA